ncbi:MAG: ArsR family transcriptional regulator [Candidatus Hodarchaeales archaeon]
MQINEEDVKILMLTRILEEIVRNRFVKKVLDSNRIRFKDLYQVLDLSETTARHHLKILLENGIIETTKEKGSRALILSVSKPFIERIRQYYDMKAPSVYLGMAGKNQPGEQVYSTVRRIEGNNISFKSVEIFTTGENSEILKKSDGWSRLLSQGKTGSVNVVKLYDYPSTVKVMTRVMNHYIENHSIIADITGGTKIHTLSLYKLAKFYGCKSVYVPEDKRSSIIYL